MTIAILVGLATALLGWRRASQRGGTRADCIQYALSHGIPGFLVSMILMTVAARLGMLG